MNHLKNETFLEFIFHKPKGTDDTRIFYTTPLMATIEVASAMKPLIFRFSGCNICETWLRFCRHLLGKMAWLIMVGDGHRGLYAHCKDSLMKVG